MGQSPTSVCYWPLVRYFYGLLSECSQNYHLDVQNVTRRRATVRRQLSRARTGANGRSSQSGKLSVTHVWQVLSRYLSQRGTGTNLRYSGGKCDGPTGSEHHDHDLGFHARHNTRRRSNAPCDSQYDEGQSCVAFRAWRIAEPWSMRVSDSSHLCGSRAS